jgi:hypothetical protein
MFCKVSVQFGSPGDGLIHKPLRQAASKLMRNDGPFTESYDDFHRGVRVVGYSLEKSYGIVFFRDGHLLGSQLATG